MRFLVDESSGTSISLFLQSLAHDAVSVADIAPQAADQDILARAVTDERIVVTNDKNFGTLVVRGGTHIEEWSCFGSKTSQPQIGSV